LRFAQHYEPPIVTTYKVTTYKVTTY
jgi:hypothetical protein